MRGLAPSRRHQVEYTYLLPDLLLLQEVFTIRNQVDPHNDGPGR